jgi:hypothetical protein
MKDVAVGFSLRIFVYFGEFMGKTGPGFFDSSSDSESENDLGKQEQHQATSTVLNQFVCEAAEKFPELMNQLRSCEWFNSEYHFPALQHLIEAEKFPPVLALAKLQILTSWQIKGISKKLTLDEVTNLSSSWQIDNMLRVKPRFDYRFLSQQNWFVPSQHLNKLVMFLDADPTLSFRDAMQQVHKNFAAEPQTHYRCTIL